MIEFENDTYAVVCSKTGNPEVHSFFIHPKKKSCQYLSTQKMVNQKISQLKNPQIPNFKPKNGLLTSLTLTVRKLDETQLSP